MDRDVSVLIVSWNARHYLEMCLNSIADAAPTCVKEVIVVDNASDDGSAELVEQSFPQHKLIRAGANLGFARANNLAMAQATGKWFALVNSDALVHPGCLEALVLHLESHPRVGLVGPRVIGGDGKLQRTCRKLPGAWNTLCRALSLDRLLPYSNVFGGYEVPASMHERPHQAQVLSGCFCVARRSAVEDVGGLDDSYFFYGEDIDWCKRFADAGWALAFLPQATATHFGGGSTSKAPLRFSIEILRATLRYWRKHHGRSGHALCYLLLLLHHGLRLGLRGAKRAIGFGHSAEAQGKLAEDLACLRWLVAGTELTPLRAQTQ
jgi:GT2 family glycosyltransferase